MGEAEGLLGEERGFLRDGGFGKAAVAAERSRKAGVESNSGERGPAFGRRGWKDLLQEIGVIGEIEDFERGAALAGEAEGLLGEERGF